MGTISKIGEAEDIGKNWDEREFWEESMELTA